MLQIDIAARTEPGARHHNEDDLRFGGNGALWHAVLADGAGGHQGGATAADLVVRLVELQLQSAGAASAELLNTALHDAHAALGERQQGRRSRERMHATVVALWIDAEREEAVWSHVGDSRLYMLRRGRVCHVTRDDSVVQQLMDAGYISAHEARDHPRKNQLLSAMGSDDAVQPHTVDEPQPIQDGDAFLLATDGWWDTLDHDAIETAFASARTAGDWLVLMAERVRRAAQPNQDNYSAVAVWVGDPAQTTRYELA
jgi:serine/threonine protein phosphatase PrpC